MSLTDHDKAFAALSKTSSELGTGVVVGAMLRFPVADGYAHYVVTKERPLTVQHVPYLDGYQISNAHIRGLKKQDVLLQIQRDKALKRIFDTRSEYLSNLKIGQIIHYHDGFNQFVRCKVVNVDGQNLLQPIALVGEWNVSALVYRYRTGEVNYEYHAKHVVNGTGAWRPSDTCIFEAPGFVRANTTDPRQLDPVSLEVPALSSEAEEEARLWVLVEQAREALSKSYENNAQISPLTMINSAKEILAGG